MISTNYKRELLAKYNEELDFLNERLEYYSWGYTKEFAPLDNALTECRNKIKAEIEKISNMPTND